MNIVAIHGSFRKSSNSSYMLQEFLRGAMAGGAHVDEFFAGRVRVTNCRGCLKCNLIRRCAIKGDDWDTLRLKIIDAQILAFASPIYFRHLTASLKTILDRFRSFMHVQITADGLHHTPWQEWKKHFVLLLSQGSPDAAEAKPVIDLFSFLTRALGSENSLHTIVGTRLAIAQQVTMSQADLNALYRKLKLPAPLAEIDHERNRMLLQSCFDLGRRLAVKKGE